MASTETTKLHLSDETLAKSYTYPEYRDMIDRLLEEGKTTGENHSEFMIHYTKMNQTRMKRLDKRSELDPELKEKLKGLDRKLYWLVLTEGWCGDAAQNLPILHKMTEATPYIEMRLILRDENLEIMDQFLTNGKSRSIPKLVCLDPETDEVLGTWGPRPQAAQELYLELKEDGEVSTETAAEYLHKWYADNKNEEIQKEFNELIEEWATVEV